MEEWLQAGYRKYSGEKVDVYYHQGMCQHAAKCVKGNPAVFEVGRRPWIMPDNGEVGQLTGVIDTCPSGALKYRVK